MNALINILKSTHSWIETVKMAFSTSLHLLEYVWTILPITPIISKSIKKVLFTAYLNSHFKYYDKYIGEVEWISSLFSDAKLLFWFPVKADLYKYGFLSGLVHSPVGKYKNYYLCIDADYWGFCRQLCLVLMSLYRRAVNFEAWFWLPKMLWWVWYH